MSPYLISVVVGSLRRDSYNRRLATALERLAPPDFVLSQVEIADLPFYNQDNDASPAESVKRLKASITRASALLFVTPEYNRSIPGVLKNVIDLASRPHGQNAWANKPAGIMGITPGTIGTACAQQHLRTILACLDVFLMGQPEVYLQVKDGLFDADGAIAIESSRKLLQSWMDRYVAWVKRLVV